MVGGWGRGVAVCELWSDGMGWGDFYGGLVFRLYLVGCSGDDCKCGFSVRISAIREDVWW